MKNLILAILLLSSASVFGKSASTSGFVEVRPGHSLYVEHYPAAMGRPTLFITNGLTFSTKDYKAFVAAILENDPGVGIVLWDMDGMGETLLKMAPITDRIPLDHQVEDLHLLKKKLGLESNTSLTGLSYGGAVALRYAALYPDDFDNYIPIAPMLERLPDQDLWISTMATWHILYAKLTPFNLANYISTIRTYSLAYMVNWHKILFPADPRSDVNLVEHYKKMLSSIDSIDQIIRSSGLPNPDNFEDVYDFYLRILIYSTYWIPEPGVLENQFKLEGVFRMVQGVKDWNAFKAAASLPPGKVHAIAAQQDEHVKLDRMDLFWASVPESARASYLRLNYSRHKVPTEWPKISAAWILKILDHTLALQKGLTFDGNPYLGEAKSGSIVIPLKKDETCESVLRTVPKPRKP